MLYDWNCSGPLQTQQHVRSVQPPGTDGLIELLRCVRTFSGEHLSPKTGLIAELALRVFALHVIAHVISTGTHRSRLCGHKDIRPQRHQTTQMQGKQNRTVPQKQHPLAARTASTVLLVAVPNACGYGGCSKDRSPSDSSFILVSSASVVGAALSSSLVAICSASSDFFFVALSLSPCPWPAQSSFSPWRLLSPWRPSP